jgi:type IV secretion system protein TrbL
VGKGLVALLVTLAGANAFAGACSLASASAGGLYDDTVNTFHGATSAWLTNANGIASHLFWGLAGIEFVWSAINWTLRKHEIGDLLASLFLKIMSITFFYWLAVLYAPTWVPMILQGFQQMATGVLGGTAATPPTVQPGMISPSAVMSVGLCIADNLTGPATKFGVTEVLDLLKNPFFALLLVFAIITVVIAYCVITLQLLLTEIEAFVVLFGGAVMLGFAGSRWTLPWGEKYFAYAVSIGVKLMVIFLVIAVGDQIVTNQVNTMLTGNETLKVHDFIVLMLTVLIYAGLAWNVPAMAGSFLNGTPHMSLGTMAGAAMASGAALAGMAAGAGSIVATGAAAAAAKAAPEGVQSGTASAKTLGSSVVNTASAGYQRRAALGQRMTGAGGGSSSDGGSGGTGTSGTSSSGGSKAGKPSGSSFNGGSSGTGAGASAGFGTPADANVGAGDQTSGGNDRAGVDTGGDQPAAAPGESPVTPSSASSPARPGTAAPPPPQEVRSTGTENAIAGVSPVQPGAAPTAEDMNKLTGAIERLAGVQGQAPYRQRAGDYAKGKLSSAAQHLRSSDGQTGTVSIRFNHHHD